MNFNKYYKNIEIINNIILSNDNKNYIHYISKELNNILQI